MTKLHNPQAFPAHGQGNGMSLRDYFAGQAMCGLLSFDYEEGKSSIEEWYLHISEISYKYADAMLKERKNDEGDQQ